MIRLLLLTLLSFLLSSPVFAQRRSWDDIKSLDSKKPEIEEDLVELQNRLDEMSNLKRESGESLFTGDRLILDTSKNSIKMDGNVLVVDDEGELQADSLIGYFSENKDLERIEAEGNVKVVSDGRHAKADQAIFTFADSLIVMEGNTYVEDDATGNNLKADRMRLWLKGNRKIVCGPKSVLTIKSLEDLSDGDNKKTTQVNFDGDTIVRTDQMVYDEENRRIDLLGDVWVKHPQATLDAGKATLFLKDENQIDYVVADEGIIIRSEGRTARASYAKFIYDQEYVELSGLATLKASANVLSGERIQFMLSGERIQFWMRDGERRMVCEPNAALFIENGGAVTTNQIENLSGGVNLWSNKIIVDEKKGQIDLMGKVRVRHPKAGMNCEKARIYLKDLNEIDWIDAQNEVIIHSSGGKALADRALYYADEGKFVLEGSPKLMKDGSFMEGDRMTFWHETSRAVCENGHVLYHLPEELRQRFLKDLEE